MRSIASTLCVLWIGLPAGGCTDKPKRSKPRATETLEPGGKATAGDFSSPGRTTPRPTLRMIVIGD